MVPVRLEIAPKSKPMALPKQSSYQGPPKVVIFLKFDGFRTSKSDPKIIKIHFENAVENNSIWKQIFIFFKQFRGRKSMKKHSSWRKLFFTKKHVFAS